MSDIKPVWVAKGRSVTLPRRKQMANEGAEVSKYFDADRINELVEKKVFTRTKPEEPKAEVKPEVKPESKDAKKQKVSLRELAESDLAITLEDPDGFGWPVTLTDPNGFSNPSFIYGQTGDIGQLIDPDTGEAVTGRLAHLSIRISTVRAAFQGQLPRGTNAEDDIPWFVTFDDINGQEYTFKVSRSAPDRTLGFINLILEAYIE